MDFRRETRKRNASILNYFQKIKEDIQDSQSDLCDELPKKRRKLKEDSDFSIDNQPKTHRKCSMESESENSIKKLSKRKQKIYSIQESDYIIQDNIDQYGKLPKNGMQLKSMLQTVEKKIYQYRQLYFQEFHQQQTQVSKVPDNAIPLYIPDVRKLDWDKLIKSQLNHAQKKYDVIMMDPPWQLSSKNPSRGVAIAYESLQDDHIRQIPVPKLSDEGFILIWVINAKYRMSVKMLEDWGYKLIDEITWVKKTVNGKIAKGHGFYLQHAKESCLVGVKGNPKYNKNICSDIIFSLRRGQSQKPTEIYEYVEQLVPNGFCLEIFARRNNLRPNWTSIGNEL